MRSSVEAEQALLGAVLCDPAGQHGVLDLVEPGDMRRPWHGQVLAAMQRLRGRGLLPSAADVYQELQDDPDLPRSVALDAVPLAGLMEASPRPAHAGAYAAIVVEAGIRQRLQLTGSRLVQAAESRDLEAALSQAARACDDASTCTARWLALPQQSRRGPALPAATPDGQVARGTASRVHPAGRAASAASARALRDLTDDPAQLAVVGKWLRPGHFAPAGQGALYAVLQNMRQAGQPIDPVTVAWEADRHGLRTDPVRLAAGIGPFAAWSAREVYRLGVLAQIARAGTAIQSDAADPAADPYDLILSTRNRLQPFRDEPQPDHEPPQAAGSAPEPHRPARTTRRMEREATR